MSNGLLGFFVLEAGEYTEQLDGALAKAAGKVPDLDVFTRNARALRGSATMARVQGIATVATGLERLGRGLRDGSLQWTPQLRGAIIAAVDDVKMLVRGVRTWGAAEDQRVAARTAELDTLAPAFSRRSVVTPMFAVGSGLWMAAETADIAAGLRRWADQALGVDALAGTEDKDYIVPIAALFPDDGGDHVVSAAPTPYVPMARVSRATGAIVMPAPTGASLQHALESGLSGLARLNDQPMAEPAHVEEDDDVVPIQDLLYRGKAALARAIKVGEGIKTSAATPDQDTLAELFDLLELATTE